MTKPTVFITGSSGLVGRALSWGLINQGYAVRGFGLGEQYFAQQAAIRALVDSGSYTFELGSIIDRMALSRAMKGCQAVVHLAAMKGPKTMADPLRCFDINVNGTYNVLESCVETKVEHFILASSSAVYGQPDRNPIEETDDVKPRNSYGVTKLAAEELTKNFSATYPQLSYTIARLFNVYGEIGNGRFAIEMFVSQVLRGENPIVFGDGLQKRCFTHADDIGSGIVAILKSPVARNKTYNLGSPNDVVSIKELAQRVIDVLALDKGLSINFNTTRAPAKEKEIVESYANISAANQDFAYMPKITIDEGLRRLAKAAADNAAACDIDESKPGWVHSV